jgi:hypothetical protein
VALTLVTAPALQAKEYHDLFATPMGLSMGGAITSYVDDWNSLYYNPAGLASVKDFHLRMPDLIHAEASLGIMQIFKKMQALDDSESIALQLKEFDGKAGSMRVSPLNFGLFFRQIGLALNLADLKTAIRLQVPTLIFARAYFDTRVDSGLSAGYGHSFMNDRLRVGFALRLLARAGSTGYLEGDEISNIGDVLGEQSGAGLGIDADFGVQSRLPETTLWGLKVKPMAGLVLQNAFESHFDLVRFKQKSFKGYAPPNERRINAGISAKLEGLSGISLIPSLELRDLMVPTNSFFEYVSMGLQIGLNTGYWFNGFIRTAYYKGTIAGGIGGNLGPGELELGTYAVALGEGFGVGVDRRYYARLALSW